MDKWGISETVWQKLHGSTGGTRQKVWTWTKILSPNIRYFGQKVHYYMVYIAYYTHLFYKFAITGKNNTFVAKIATSATLLKIEY